MCVSTDSGRRRPAEETMVGRARDSSSPRSADEPWLERAVLVFGQMKSGVTLLRDMLDGNPEMLVYPDQPYFRLLYQREYASERHMVIDWLIGNRSRNGFIFNFLGCLVWVLVAVRLEIYGLLLVVVPAVIVNLRNYMKWTGSTTVRSAEKDSWT